MNQQVFVFPDDSHMQPRFKMAVLISPTHLQFSSPWAATARKGHFRNC